MCSVLRYHNDMRVLAVIIFAGILAAAVYAALEFKKSLPSKENVSLVLEPEFVIQESEILESPTSDGNRILDQSVGKEQPASPEPAVIIEQPTKEKELDIASPPVASSIELPPADIVAEVVPVAAQKVASIINEDEIMSAVVRVRCGKSYGSGFVIEKNEVRYALTAAHVAIDQIEVFKNYQCDVIFPRKDENGNYKEAHYRIGKILLPEETAQNYKEKGIDLAILEIQSLADQAEDTARFPGGYPYISQQFCPTNTLGDSVNLWGYAANLGTAITPGAFLSKFQGEIVQYEDVVGVIRKPSLEFFNGIVYLPKIEHSLDQGVFHHLTVIVSDNNFSGASGGLVLDTVKGCIAGVNIATLVQDYQVFGFVTNSQFEPIKDFIDRAVIKI